MKLKRKSIVLGVALALAMTGWIAEAYADGVLKIGRQEGSTTFDPITSAVNVDLWIYGSVFDVLVRSSEDGTEIEPGLAEEWDVSDDGLTYTFKLRDAKFSDGSPVTAEDAKFSIARIRDSDRSVWSDSYQVIENMDVVDDHTLVIKLSQKTVPFLATLATPSASILPQKVIEDIGIDKFASKPVGAGPFKLTKWKRGEKLVLEKNEHYWDADTVKLDGVEWLSIPNDNTRMLNVETGEIDAAIFVPFSRADAIDANPDLKLIEDVSTREDSLLINHSHPPLDNVKVREAIDMAIDKQSIIDGVTFGYGEVADSLIPAGALYHDEDALHRDYDPEKAKQILEEEGASDLELDYLLGTGDEIYEQTAIIIQKQLADIGVKVNIVKVDPSQKWSMLVDGEYDLSEAYWVYDLIDPDQKVTFSLGHDSNMNYMTRYENDEVKDLVAAGRLEMDPDKREEIYLKAQKLAKEDVHWVDLYYSPFINVTRANVEGFHQTPLGQFTLYRTEIK